MSFLHVLFAVRLPLRSVRAGLVQAFVELRQLGVFVIHVTFTFFLRWPTLRIVSAVWVGTLPWTGMCLLVLCQVTRSSEALATFSA